MQNECLPTIVGFSQNNCECFSGEFSDDQNVSDSGLYMDQLPETEHILPAVKGTTDCGKSMEDLFIAARRTAILEFSEKLMEAVGTRYKVRQDPFIGQVGQIAYTGNVNTTSNYVGVALQMKEYKGGNLRIKKINIALNETLVELPLNIYKAYQVGNFYQIQELIATVPVDSTANAVHVNELETPIDLPLSDDSSHIVHYLFLMDRSAGWLPKNMTVRCSCYKQTQIEKWLIQGGIQGNDHEALLTSQKKTGAGDYINGIVLDVEIKCNDVSFICENYHRSPYLAIAVSHAIWYQAGSNLLKSILRSNSVNRFQLTKREQMSTDAQILHNKFKSRVLWIGENMDLSTNTCFVCNTMNESAGPYVAGIRF